MTRIAFLGLGAMGARMAGRLLQAGHDLTVWNRSPSRAEPLVAKGARQAATPADAAAGCDFCISMVRDDAASRAVWTGGDGALASLSEANLAVECSTIGPGWAAELARMAGTRRIVMLEAPVLGSRKQADAGALIFLAGGTEAAAERFRPLAAELGSACHLVGGTGAGTATKLIANGLFAAQLAALAEMIALADRHGLDAGHMLSVLAGTPVFSPAMGVAGAAMLAGHWQPQFPIELVVKDLGLLAEVADPGPTPVADRVREVYQAALDEGYGADNITAIIRRYSSA